MIAHLATFIDGLLRYLLLCVVSITTGVGFMRLVRLNLPSRLGLVLAPVLTMVCWSVGLGIGVALRTPVRYLTGPFWAITLGVAIYGFSRVLTRNNSSSGPATRRGFGFAAIARKYQADIGQASLRSLFSRGWLIALCVLLPVVVMFPYFSGGLTNYPGSIMPDGWSYIAYGQYLWQYPRGADGGLAPLYQYAAHLSETRFISSSLLGFLSPLFSSGDTQLVSNLFFSELTSCSRNMNHQAALQAFAIFTFTVCSTWFVMTRNRNACCS